MDSLLSLIQNVLETKGISSGIGVAIITVLCCGAAILYLSKIKIKTKPKPRVPSAINSEVIAAIGFACHTYSAGSGKSLPKLPIPVTAEMVAAIGVACNTFVMITGQRYAKLKSATSIPEEIVAVLCLAYHQAKSAEC